MSTPEPPELTEEEEQASPERRVEEDAMRGPGHEDPDDARSSEP
jgi:hypothetical protein